MAIAKAGEPDPVRRGSDEVALEQVRGDREVVTAVGGAHPCKSANHLTPNRLPTLTPPIALEVIATAKEISSGLGSRLGTDWGQSSEPIHNQTNLVSFGSN